MHARSADVCHDSKIEAGRKTKVGALHLPTSDFQSITNFYVYYR